MKISFKIFAFFLLICASVALCSCGKTSHPSPMDGSGYPHSYPRY